MKRLLGVITLFFLFSNSVQSVKEITSFDIARWYLDSDLVIICTVNQIDTITINSYDSLRTDDINVHYDNIREKYSITIDSVIKGGQADISTMDSIFTPVFDINYSKTQQINREFTGYDLNGDSTFLVMVNFINDDYCDDTYFRLSFQTEHLVILTKTISGYIIDYETEINDDILTLLEEVKAKGKSYFP